MSEPTIICPSCKTEIKLTESLAAPIINTIKLDYEKKLHQKDQDMIKREETLQSQQHQLLKEKESIQDQVAEKVKHEQVRISAEEAKKARLAIGNDIEEKLKEISSLQEILKSRDAKLEEAQKLQAEFMRKERALADEKREMDLTIEKRVQESQVVIRDQAKKDAEELLNLKVKEKEQTISSMQKQIEELKRRAEQGSQQLQGEVLELELESLLRSACPRDTIHPVPKGEFGGDILHRVLGPTSETCGTILWESKRTKNWTDTWLSKLREDQRTAKAEIAVIVSYVLPKDIESFAFIDGVWVTHPRVAIPLAGILRNTLIDISHARKSVVGQETKKEMVYQYLSSPRFRQRVEAIVEAFSSMKEDLDKERKAIMKQWAKREEQIMRVTQATVGMYGDLQGIVGRSLQEIDGLDIEMIEAPLNGLESSSCL